MNPLPPGDPITLPQWVMQYMVAPVAVGLFSLLWWLGGKVIDDWESQQQHLQEEVKTIKGELRKMRDQMGNEHGEVEDYVQRLDDKLDKIHQEVGS